MGRGVGRGVGRGGGNNPCKIIEHTKREREREGVLGGGWGREEGGGRGGGERKSLAKVARENRRN